MVIYSKHQSTLGLLLECNLLGHWEPAVVLLLQHVLNAPGPYLPGTTGLPEILLCFFKTFCLTFSLYLIVSKFGKCFWGKTGCTFEILVFSPTRSLKPLLFCLFSNNSSLPGKYPHFQHLVPSTESVSTFRQQVSAETLA